MVLVTVFAQFYQLIVLDKNLVVPQQVFPSDATALT